MTMNRVSELMRAAESVVLAWKHREFLKPSIEELEKAILALKEM